MSLPHLPASPLHPPLLCNDRRFMRGTSRRSGITAPHYKRNVSQFMFSSLFTHTPLSVKAAALQIRFHIQLRPAERGSQSKRARISAFPPIRTPAPQAARNHRAQIF
ncbi:hypothetical protein NQZ68_038439 [Dissostichus eleginoides]|nr:hypothetical protein NQZ68_038439 [Dissostichus eleginoides]